MKTIRYFIIITAIFLIGCSDNRGHIINILSDNYPTENFIKNDICLSDSTICPYICNNNKLEIVTNNVNIKAIGIDGKLVTCTEGDYHSNENRIMVLQTGIRIEAIKSASTKCKMGTYENN